jgi:hypothetical protein
MALFSREEQMALIQTGVALVTAHQNDDDPATQRIIADGYSYFETVNGLAALAGALAWELADRRGISTEQVLTEVAARAVWASVEDA